MLHDKVALVTGGSRGIGRAIAIALAEAGASVCINFEKNYKKAQEVLKELKEISSKNHLMISFDVASYSSVEAGLKECLTTCSTIDILVNNAGVTRDNLLPLMKESDWDQVINTNLKGVFNCTKIVSRLMIKRKWGRIINMASLVGEVGNAGQTNYAASKAGMIGFTKSLAKELGSRHITVNAVSPGFVETEMLDALSDEFKKEMCKKIPVGYFGSCEDIAHLVAFLASDKASYITGQVIGVNGGLSI